MKIKISKVQIVNVEIELNEFINSKQCYLEFIDHEVHPTYTAWDEYPNENFIMVYQEYDSGEWNLREIGYIISNKEPTDMKSFVIENIDKFVAFEE